MAQQTVISWQQNLSTRKEGKKTTHAITFIHIDSVTSMVKVVIEKGIDVDSINMTMEHAEDIGFINFEALKQYCK